MFHFDIFELCSVWFSEKVFELNSVYFIMEVLFYVTKLYSVWLIYSICKSFLFQISYLYICIFAGERWSDQLWCWLEIGSMADGGTHELAPAASASPAALTETESMTPRKYLYMCTYHVRDIITHIESEGIHFTDRKYYIKYVSFLISVVYLQRKSRFYCRLVWHNADLLILNNMLNNALNNTLIIHWPVVKGFQLVILLPGYQGLTLRFQARGPKRSFDKFNRISVLFCIYYQIYYFGPLVWKI